ncbi:hypothetical protein QL689_000839, partial [Campylobacter coli]|nr:hypothetical protein [Campylobacter coli]
LNTQFSSYFNDEEFVNFKKGFEAKNALNYRDFKEFRLEETDKERLKIYKFAYWLISTFVAVKI